MISRKECQLFVTYMMMSKICSILGEFFYPVNIKPKFPEKFV
jgi:hypothetical protein